MAEVPGLLAPGTSWGPARPLQARHDRGSRPRAGQPPRRRTVLPWVVSDLRYLLGSRTSHLQPVRPVHQGMPRAMP